MRVFFLVLLVAAVAYLGGRAATVESARPDAVPPATVDRSEPEPAPGAPSVVATGRAPYRSDEPAAVRAQDAPVDDWNVLRRKLLASIGAQQRDETSELVSAAAQFAETGGRHDFLRGVADGAGEPSVEVSEAAHFALGRAGRGQDSTWLDGRVADAGLPWRRRWASFLAPLERPLGDALEYRLFDVRIARPVDHAAIAAFRAYLDSAGASAFESVQDRVNFYSAAIPFAAAVVQDGGPAVEDWLLNVATGDDQPAACRLLDAFKAEPARSRAIDAALRGAHPVLRQRALGLVDSANAKRHEAVLRKLAAEDGHELVRGGAFKTLARFGLLETKELSAAALGAEGLTGFFARVELMGRGAEGARQAMESAIRGRDDYSRVGEILNWWSDNRGECAPIAPDLAREALDRFGSDDRLVMSVLRFAERFRVPGWKDVVADVAARPRLQAGLKEYAARIAAEWPAK